MDKAIGVVTLAFMITALAIVVSKRTNTVAVINSILNGIIGIQKATTAPL